MKKAASNLGTTVLVILIAAAVFTFLAPRFGWRVDAVFSGSMEPEIKVGSIIATRPVEAETMEVGDIITFNSPLSEIPTTHRVVSVEKGSELRFQTKGDANEDVDPFTVPAQNVMGKVCFHVPYLGYVSQFSKTPLGFILLLCVPGLVIVVMEIRNIRRVLTEKQVEGRYGIG
jgi:signal peptidase